MYIIILYYYILDVLIVTLFLKQKIVLKAFEFNCVSSVVFCTFRFEVFEAILSRKSFNASGINREKIDAKIEFSESSSV